MSYEYLVVPFFDQVVEGDFTDEVARTGCRNLQNLLNQHAAQGWEYYRSEEVLAHTYPGVFSSLAGRAAMSQRYKLMVFRKPA